MNALPTMQNNFHKKFAHERVWTDDELDDYVLREYGVDKEDEDRLFRELWEWAGKNVERGRFDRDFIMMYLR